MAKKYFIPGQGKVDSSVYRDYLSKKEDLNFIQEKQLRSLNRIRENGKFASKEKIQAFKNYEQEKLGLDEEKSFIQPGRDLSEFPNYEEVKKNLFSKLQIKTENLNELGAKLAGKKINWAGQQFDSFNEFKEKLFQVSGGQGETGHSYVKYTEYFETNEVDISEIYIYIDGEMLGFDSEGNEVTVNK